VLVRLRGGVEPGQLVLIKELVRRSAAFLELRQFNPATTFRVDANEIEAIQKVAGEVI
jgi:phage repressor protein C with HTH and peptisase S24 domain